MRWVGEVGRGLEVDVDVEGGEERGEREGGEERKERGQGRGGRGSTEEDGTEECTMIECRGKVTVRYVWAEGPPVRGWQEEEEEGDCRRKRAWMDEFV